MANQNPYEDYYKRGAQRPAAPVQRPVLPAAPAPQPVNESLPTQIYRLYQHNIAVFKHIIQFVQNYRADRAPATLASLTQLIAIQRKHPLFSDGEARRRLLWLREDSSTHAVGGDDNCTRLVDSVNDYSDRIQRLFGSIEGLPKLVKENLALSMEHGYAAIAAAQAQQINVEFADIEGKCKQLSNLCGTVLAALGPQHAPVVPEPVVLVVQPPQPRAAVPAPAPARGGNDWYAELQAGQLGAVAAVPAPQPVPQPVAVRQPVVPVPQPQPAAAQPQGRANAGINWYQQQFQAMNLNNDEQKAAPGAPAAGVAANPQAGAGAQQPRARDLSSNPYAGFVKRGYRPS